MGRRFFIGSAAHSANAIGMGLPVDAMLPKPVSNNLENGRVAITRTDWTFLPEIIRLERQNSMATRQRQVVVQAGRHDGHF